MYAEAFFATYSAEYFDQDDDTTLGAMTRESYQNIYFNEQASKLYEQAVANGTIDSDALKQQAYDKAKQADYDSKYDAQLEKAKEEIGTLSEEEKKELEWEIPLRP